LYLVSTALGLAYPAAFWLSGLSVAFWSWLLQAGFSPWSSAAVLLALYMLGEALTLFPFSYLSGFVVAHRFKLSRQTFTEWLADWLKGMFLALALGLGVGMLFFWTLTSLDQHWWWVFGLMLSAGFALIGFIAPYVLVPLFFKMRPVEDEQLVERLRALFARAGVRVRNVCTLDFSRKTAEANAAVIGMGQSRRIVLADTLLETFSAREIDSVMAHELGHHVHRDVPRMLLLQSVIMLAGLAAAHWLGLPLVAQTVGLRIDELPAALPLLAGAAQLFFLAIMPLTNAYSRRVETQADRFSLDLTRDAEAFCAAMRKLGTQNLLEEQPPAWAEVLLHSHPSIGHRVQFAVRWRASDIGGSRSG
jgi:STE24 endopeptidase